MKEITRGKKVKIEDFHEFAGKLEIDKKVIEKMQSITPENYTGIAEKLVDDFDPKIN